MLIDRIYYPTKTLGWGNRVGIWTVGCPHHCYNCSNPELWNFDVSKNIKITDIVKVIIEYIGDLNGITITGGDPFAQVEELLVLLKEIAKLRIIDILVYTGYTLSEILEKGREYKESLEYIGVLVDGKYIDKLNNNIGMCGSTNQMIYILNSKLNDRYKNFKELSRKSQIVLTPNGNIISIGIPIK